MVPGAVAETNVAYWSPMQTGTIDRSDDSFRLANCREEHAASITVDEECCGCRNVHPYSVEDVSWDGRGILSRSQG
jgi:hypothetical protein